MGSLSNFAEKKVLDHALKTASYSPPATVYLALSTANPLIDGSGLAEPSYTGYGRKAISFLAAAARASVQTGDVDFDPCTLGSATVGYWAIMDQQAAGGNMLAYGALAASKSIVAGNTPVVASGQVSITFSAGAIFSPIAQTILDWLFRGQAFSQPTHVKVGLSTTTPTDGGPNITEPSGNAYAQVNQDSWNAATSSPEQATNNGEIDFISASGSWGTITYAIIYLDANPFGYFTVTNQAVGNGDTVKFLTTTITISLT